MYYKSIGFEDKISSITIIVTNMTKRKTLSDFSLFAPWVGIEPTTNRLTGDRSTAELPRNNIVYIIDRDMVTKNWSKSKTSAAAEVLLYLLILVGMNSMCIMITR